MTVNSRRMDWPYPGRDDDPWYDGFDDLVQALDASGFASREDRGLVLTGGGTVTWTLPAGILAWSGAISIFSPLSAFLVQVAAGSATLADGQVLYVDLSRFPLENKTVTATVASAVPSTDNAYIIAVRVGARVYLRTGHSLGNGDSLSGFSPGPGGGAAITLETQEEGVQVHADTRTIDFVGDGVTATNGGPNKTTVTVPGLEVQDEGVQVELPTTKLDFRGKTVQVTNPAPGEARVTVSGLEVEEEGVSVETGVVNIDFTGAGVTASKTGAGQVRVDVPGGAADRTTARIIVGNSVNGDTSSDCDYLDVGDGVQLAAAIAASGVNDDVYVRPGLYDLGAGVAVAPLTVPAGVHLRGAGRKHTIVRTKAAGDQGAFILGADSLLEDIGVDIALPVGPCVGSTMVVSLRGDRAACHRVDVEFLGVWTPLQVALTVLRSVFEVGWAPVFAADHAQLFDCRVGLVARAPSWLDLGLPPGNELVLFSVQTGIALPLVSATLKDCYGNGGDRTVVSFKAIKIFASTCLSFMDRGVFLNGADTFGSEVADNHIVWDPAAPVSIRGIVLDTTVNASVVDNYLMSDVPSPGQVAIELISADYNTIRGNRGPGVPTAVYLDANSDDNVVTGNNFAGSIYTDLGAGNDVAHNI